MRNQLLVTAFGEDRPGIVARLSEVFASHGGNLEASRMSLLGGEFAAISLVTVADEKLASLEKALADLAKDGLTVACKRTRSLPLDGKTHKFYDIHLTGADQEGIVHRVSSYLSGAKVNIHNVQTDIINAPVTGLPLFTMHAEIAVPESLSYEKLSQDLSHIADELNVEIDLVSSTTLHAELVEA